MRIAATSDLHGTLPKLEACDICVISGDIFPLKAQRNFKQCQSWLNKVFYKWCKEQPCKQYVFIPGNHDFYIEDLYNKVEVYDMPDILELPVNVHILIDSSINIEGIKIFGTPWISGLPNWAFNKDEEYLKEYFKNVMPNECDIVLTHAAPAIDQLGTVLQTNWNYMKDFSSAALANAYKGKNIKYAFNGHIHSGVHADVHCNGTIFRNVSLNDENYNPTYPVHYFDI